MTDLVQMAREIFAEVIPSELEKLTNAYQTSDWESIHALVHKMKSSAVYCDFLSLRDACANLEEHLRTSKDTVLRDKLYQTVLSEIKSAKKSLKLS